MYLALDVWFTLLFKPRPDVLLVFFLCFCIQDSFTFFGFLHCSVFGSSHFDHLYFVYLSWFLFLQLLRCFSSLSSFSFEVSFFGDLRFLSSLLSFRFRFRPFINLPSLPSNILFYYFSLSLALILMFALDYARGESNPFQLFGRQSYWPLYYSRFALWPLPGSHIYQILFY